MRTQKSRRARFAAGLPAVVHLPKNDYEGKAFNLSRSGALLVGRFPPLVGYRVELSLRGSPQGEAVRLAGRVVRGERQEDGDHLAVEFIELTPDRRDRLELLLSRVIEGHEPAPIAALEPGASTEEIRRALDQVPLPHRIALAIRAGRREREVLLHDTNARVLEALARNPNLLVTEARTLAGTTAVLPSTLELMSRDPRWGRDEDVRAALLSHPRLPARLAGKILDGLDAPELRRLAQRSGLPATLRGEVRKRLTRA